MAWFKGPPKVRLVQGYFAGLEVPPKALADLLVEFGVQTPPPSPPSPLEVVRELVIARAGLGPDFYWQDMADGYYLMTEGDPQPWGRIPLVESLSLEALPPALRAALQWAISRRRTVATPSAIQRALAAVAFHHAQGLCVANLRGLPGAIVIPPAGAAPWAAVEHRLQESLPQVHGRLIWTEASIAGPVEIAVADELKLAGEMAALEVGRLQERLLDPSAQVPSPTAVTLALGRALQGRALAFSWEGLAVNLAADFRGLREAFQRLVADLEVMLGTLRQEAP